MTDQKDPADLARRFVDLWQDQMTAVLRDPEFRCRDAVVAILDEGRFYAAGWSGQCPGTGPRR